MKRHFEVWGWLSFLTYVGENATIFYRQNGKSNIENIKAEKLFNVLVWASEKKDKEEEINRYYENNKQ